MRLIISILFISLLSCGKTQHIPVTINAGHGVTVSINDTGSAPHVDPNSIYFNTNDLWPGLTRTSKSLIKIAMVGNSLFGNPLGGSIPAELDEGDGARPMRLTYDNLSRRFYDQISWNKATHRRLDHSDWAKGSTWSEYTTVFEPSYSNERIYQTSIDANYAEIVIPDGQENFAFICQRAPSLATLTITLNGGSISAYGPSTVNCARTALSGEVNGNPYNVVEYNNLPSGVNTIRITKSSSGTVRIWGGFYWTGNTVIVHNLGHGGHTMGELITEHLRAEVDDNNYDAIIFEMTELNELSQVGIENVATSVTNLQSIIDNHIGSTPSLILSTSILGTDPSDGTPNYYQTLPGHKQLNNILRNTVKQNGLPYIDIFSGFERLIIAAGGSLEDGDAGVYTTDGQHPNPEGVAIWFNMMLPILIKVLPPE